MGIRDWLFEKKRTNEAQEFFRKKMREYDSLSEQQGSKSADGYPVCPHCGHIFSLVETIEQGTIAGLPVFECPGCKQAFKI